MSLFQKYCEFDLSRETEQKQMIINANYNVEMSIEGIFGKKNKEIKKDVGGLDLHKKLMRGVPKDGGKDKLKEISEELRVHIKIRPKVKFGGVYDDDDQKKKVVENADIIEKQIPKFKEAINKIGWDFVDIDDGARIATLIDNYNKKHGFKSSFNDIWRYYNEVTYGVFTDRCLVELPKYKNLSFGYTPTSVDEKDGDHNKIAMNTLGFLYALIRDKSVTDKLVVNRIAIASIKAKSIFEKWGILSLTFVMYFFDILI